MDDDFEAQFADEMEALEEIETDDFLLDSRSRRSLTFTSPPKSSLQDAENLDESQLTPMFSPTEMTGSMVRSDKTQPKKRVQEEMHRADSGLTHRDEETDLPDFAPRRKRQRPNENSQKTASSVDDELDEDDFQITPPPSPKMTKKPTNHNAAGSVSDRLTVHQDRLLDDFDLERRRVLTRIPAGDFMTVTAEDGRRLYMSLKAEEDVKLEVEKVLSNQHSMQLLGKPLLELRQQVEEEKRRRVLEESERLSSELARSLAETEDDLAVLDEPAIPRVKLWVEQYAPCMYTELLSDESTNRTVLKWLKLWDKVVFGRERINKKPSAADSKKKEQKGNFKHSQYELTEELDEHGRPLHKIALLCGPPGLGKTTLAHVLAKHAGYNVVEMNASDDRSVDVFKTKIEAATQMKAVMGADPRPNCLIIDEIDGAPQPAINMLLSLVKKTDQPSKKKRENQPLLRPIICICNDQYTPALRQLRQNSLILNFPPTVPSKLALRLQEIIRIEKLRSDMTTLMALCEKSENDIRSCLNTLQFIQRRCQQLTLQMVQSMSLGQKDQHKSLFYVWTAIFTIPKQKRRRYINPHERTQENMEEQAAMIADNNTSISARFHNIQQMVQAAGEYEKVMQGLFENYLEAKFKDTRLEKLTHATEWLCFVDQLNQKIGHAQLFEFYRYIPYLMVLFHLLFASNAPNKCKYPSSGYEFHVNLNKSMSLINSLLTEISPQVKKTMNLCVSVTEVLPLLTEIIQPTLRPVNTQLYSTREKNDLTHLIDIMIAYNLTYHQERTADGQYAYMLDPNVDQVVRFSGMKQQRQLSYAAKQLIAREIELEKMRRSEATFGSAAKYVAPSVDSKKKQDTSSPAVPNHMQKLEPKCIKVTEDKICRDFFGRVIKKSEPSAKSGEKRELKKPVISSDIWFRFQEGFSNAVRKTIRVQDFL